jgi:hypothetical protein
LDQAFAAVLWDDTIPREVGHWQIENPVKTALQVHARQRADENEHQEQEKMGM